MKNQRKILSPYYDFKVFQHRNTYMKLPKKSPVSKGDASTPDKQSIKRHEKSCSLEMQTKSIKSYELLKNQKRCSSNGQEEGIGDFSDYRSMSKENKSCQTYKFKKRIVKTPRRIVSHSYLTFRNQLMSRK